MSGKELNFNEASLASLVAALQAQKSKLQQAGQRMKQTDGTIAGTLRGDTHNAYLQRSAKVNKAFAQSMEALDELIRQVEQSNDAALTMDKSIANKMVK